MITDNVILKARKKDSEACEIIYAELKDFVWNVALKTSRNTYSAEDVTSEVFVKVFSKINQFKFNSSFKSWVYRITVNTALNHMKKERKNNTGVLYDIHVDNITDSNEFEERDTVYRLLSELPDKHRIIIILREIEGLSYKEIAEAMKMGLNTVKINIYRARDQLRKLALNKGGIKDVVLSK